MPSGHVSENRLRATTKPVFRPALRLAFAGGWLLGVALRLWNLPAQVVSDDEMHTVRAVLGHPVRELLSSYGRYDYSLPMAAFYRALSDAGVGLSEAVLRLLPLVAGLATLVLLPLGLRAWLGTRAALWHAWLLAVSLPLVYYSRVVRPYSWSTLLAVVAVAAFARWWREGRARHLAAYVAGGGLGVWFLPLVAPFVGAPLLWAAVDASRRRDATAARRLVVAAAALAGAVALAFGPAAADLAGAVSAKVGRSSPGLAAWAGALQLHAGSRSALLAAAVAALVVAGFVRHLRTERWAACYWALPVLVQALAVQVAAPLGAGLPFVLERYLLPTLPVLLAWAALALATPPRPPAWRWAAGLAGAGVVAALLATTPFADAAFRRSPFMGHKDYLQLYAAPGRLPAEAVPATYGILLSTLPPGPVLEYPWFPVWHFTDALRLYQEVHGRDVVVAAPPGRLQDPRLAFRSMVPGTAEGLLASRARFLLLHRDYPREEARVVEPEWPSARIRWSVAILLRRAATLRSQELQRLWGPPDWQDGTVAVWDLDRVRRLGVCAAESQGRVTGAAGPDPRRRDGGDAEPSSRSGNDGDDLAPPVTLWAHGGCGTSPALLVVDDATASPPPRALDPTRKTHARDPGFLSRRLLAPGSAPAGSVGPSD